MVKPELLEENKYLLLSGNVAENGRLWGDAEDPEEVEAREKVQKSMEYGRKRAKTVTTRHR